MMNENERVAIVTGAAGGMGSAIAAQLARSGWSLILGDLHDGPLQSLAASLGGGTNVAAVAGDITERTHVDAMLALVGPRKIGALVHTAGVSPSMADGRRIFAINFTATRALVEACLPRMASDGAAVLIASNSGQLIARPMFDRAVRKLIAGKSSIVAQLMLRSSRTAYPLSKRAVQIYAQMMAPSFGRTGSRIVSLSPGIIDTEMGRLENQAGPELQKMIDAASLGRRGLAHEIASAVSFLVSPAASYITGTDILVDGGTIAGIEAAGGAAKLR